MEGRRERNSPSVSNIYIGVFGENSLSCKCHQPLSQIPLKCSLKLGLGQQTANGNSCIIVLALVQIPARTIQIVNRSYASSCPSNWQLSTFILKPKHEFLRGGRGGISLNVIGHEVITDVSFEGGGVAAGPGVASGDRGDTCEFCLEILGQADEGVSFGDVVSMVS